MLILGFIVEGPFFHAQLMGFKIPVSVQYNGVKRNKIIIVQQQL